MSSRRDRASFERDLTTILTLAERPGTTVDDIAVNLRLVYEAFSSLDFGRYEPKTVQTQAHALAAAIFESRLRLRDRLPVWRSEGLTNPSVQRAVRDVFRIQRYAVDMLGELGISHGRLLPAESVRRGFTGRDHNTFVNPRFWTGSNIPFRSGDALLVRGMAHNSAAIARIGDVDSQFSHMAIVYIDGRGGHWVVESLIEDGAVVNTLEHALDHGIGRAVLYRHKDADLAQRAAETIHARVRASEKGWHRHIPYDFSMRLAGRRRLFCSKLVAQAFHDASGGKVDLPAYRTRLDMHNRDFFQRIGVKAKETFAPADIDIDPDFDLVAEWQDYRVTPDLRLQDMVMTKFFEWMEVHGFRFKEDWLVRIIALLGRFSTHLSRRVRELLAGVVPKVPANMSRRCIATIVMLHKSAEGVMPALRALEQNRIRMTGMPLHPQEALHHLERLRQVTAGRIGYLSASRSRMAALLGRKQARPVVSEV